MRSVVVLPEPLGPRNPVTRPGGDLERQVVDGHDRDRTAWSTRGLRWPKACQTVARTVPAGGAPGSGPAGRPTGWDSQTSAYMSAGSSRPDGHHQLVVDPAHVAPAVDPADQGRVPDVAEDPGPVARLSGWGSPMARVMMPSISTDTCCWHSTAAGSGEARAVKTAPPAGLASHGPQGPVEHVDDPLGRGVALGRVLGQAGVELLDPVDQGRGQQVVLAGEVAVDRAHGHVGPGGHVAHLDGLVAPLEPQGHGRVDHPLAPGLLGPGQGRAPDGSPWAIYPPYSAGKLAPPPGPGSAAGSPCRPSPGVGTMVGTGP
jgi:hypothetical protein